MPTPKALHRPAGPIIDRLPTFTRNAPASAGDRSEGRRKESVVTAIDAAGVADIVFGPPPSDGYWLIERIVVVTNSAAATEARMFTGDADDANLEDGTSTGNLDIADETQPIVVPGGSEFRIRWTGGTVGARAVGRIQYEARRLG